MESIGLVIHFVLELFKISIQGCFYATFFLLLFKLIAKYDTEGWFALVTSKKRVFWFKTGFLASSFLFSFSYWGNHGLGPHSRIPLGYDKEVARMDFMNTSDGPDYATYAVKNEFVCGVERVIEAPDMNKKTYLIWNLKTNKVLTFYNLDNYTAYAKLNNLPLPNAFISFEEQYSNFWNGWRFWFLA